MRAADRTEAAIARPVRARPLSMTPLKAGRATRRLSGGGPVLLYCLFGGLIVWWALGMGGFVQVLVGTALLAAVCTRADVRAPKGIGLFLAFLGWVLLSAVHVSG